MYSCPLTKAELIKRITDEHRRLIYNAENVKTDIEKSIYTEAAHTIAQLMTLCEITEKEG